MNYKKLSEVLKYGHDEFHSILNSMTHNDLAGNMHADMNKRAVLADAYKEWMGDQGRDEEADEGVHHLQQPGHPVVFHGGKIKPAVEKRHTVYMHNLLPDDLRAYYSTLHHIDLIDMLFGLSPNERGSLFINRNTYGSGNAHIRNLWDPLHSDRNTEHKGYIVSPSMSPNHYNPVVDRHILVPLEHAHHDRINTLTDKTYKS
jgi:hypothetical protein